MKLHELITQLQTFSDSCQNAEVNVRYDSGVMTEELVGVYQDKEKDWDRSVHTIIVLDVESYESHVERER